MRNQLIHYLTRKEIDRNRKDIAIEKLNVRVKKIQGILQITKHE